MLDEDRRARRRRRARPERARHHAPVGPLEIPIERDPDRGASTPIAHSTTAAGQPHAPGARRGQPAGDEQRAGIQIASMLRVIRSSTPPAIKQQVEYEAGERDPAGESAPPGAPRVGSARTRAPRRARAIAIATGSSTECAGPSKPARELGHDLAEPAPKRRVRDPVRVARPALADRERDQREAAQPDDADRDLHGSPRPVRSTAARPPRGRPRTQRNSAWRARAPTRSPTRRATAAPASPARTRTRAATRSRGTRASRTSAPPASTRSAAGCTR